MPSRRPHRPKPSRQSFPEQDRSEARKKLEAQDLAYQAMQAAAAGRVEEACDLCSRAIALWEACLDAHLLLLRHVEMPLPERIDLLRHLVAVGLEDLGERFVLENAGMLWLDIDGRPLMRALGTLATTLPESRAKGALDEAIETAETMLELDGEDHLGIRGSLAVWFIARQRWEDLRALLSRFEECGMLELAWARVILAFETEGADAATAVLRDAMNANRHAVDYLLGRRRHRGPLPAIIEWRGESEAVLAAHQFRPAWPSIPQFRKWLEKGVPAVKRRARKPRVWRLRSDAGG